MSLSSLSVDEQQAVDDLEAAGWRVIISLSIKTVQLYGPSDQYAGAGPSHSGLMFVQRTFKPALFTVGERAAVDELVAAVEAAL